MKKLSFLNLGRIVGLLLINLSLSHIYAFNTNENLALGKTAVARDSKSFDGSGINPNYVTDGNMSSHWCALYDDDGKGSWIYVDLNNYYLIDSVQIAWRGDRWPNGQWFLQVATNEPDATGESNWINVYEGNKGSDVISGTGYYKFTETAGRYVRMKGVARSTGYGYNIFEFRVYANEVATPVGDADTLVISPAKKTVMVNQKLQLSSFLKAENGVPMDVAFTANWTITNPLTGATINSSGLFKATETGIYTVKCSTTYESELFETTAVITVVPFDTDVNIALNKTATASNSTDGPASKGNDGSLDSRWRSNNANQKEWWKVDLGTDYYVNNVKVKMKGDAGARGATYNLLVSLTGEDGTWTTVTSSATIPSGSGEEFNNHTFTPTPARYVKYDGQTKGGWDHNFAEFEVRASGFYYADVSSNFASVQFNNTSVIEGEEVALTIVALDEDNNPFSDATITTVEVTVGSPSGVTFAKRDGVWYATGVTEGTYTLLATGIDDEDEDNIHTKTAILTVQEARRVVTINISKGQDSPNAYATNRVNPLNVSCVDQYGQAIIPTLSWNITGVTGSVSDKKFTATSKGTASVKATSTTRVGTVESNILSFEIVTNNPNVAKNKTVTSISGATGNSNAVDESEATQWIYPHVPESNNIYDAWLVIDLEKKYEIELIEVIWEGAYSKTFTVDYSDDGVSYSTKYHGSNTGGTITKYNKFYADPSSARYVRVYSTEAGSIYGTKILDIYVHGKEDIGTASNNMIETEKIKFYPNPTSDIINFSSTVQQATIYSLDGQEIMSAGKVNSMNVSNLNKGIYIIKVVDANMKSSFSKIEIR